MSRTILDNSPGKQGIRASSTAFRVDAVGQAWTCAVLQQHVVISRRHAVAGLEPRPSARGRTIGAPPLPLFRILRRSAPPPCVDFVPACPAEAENVHAR